MNKWKLVRKSGKTVLFCSALTLAVSDIDKLIVYRLWAIGYLYMELTLREVI
jgi:hypothetical protein